MATILFAAGDPGGAGALEPVIAELVRRRAAVAVLGNGSLPDRCPSGVPRLYVGRDGDLSDILHHHAVGCVCFGTSLSDRLPLALARLAQSGAIPTVAVLDNWMNYRARLEIDGAPLFLPTTYAVMDGKAHGEALAEGLPAAALAITGHPGLAGLGAEAALADEGWRRAKRAEWCLDAAGRSVVVFIGEPVEKDQGAVPGTPGYRGYTERTVLARLCRALQPLHDAIRLVVVPHPRDSVLALEDLWQQTRGCLEGRVVTGVPGRQAVLCADRVVGMASVLLYESWLLGRPTLSLQPGLVRPDLTSLAARPDLVFVQREEEVDAAVESWWRQQPRPPRPDLALHREAPQRVADLLQAACRSIPAKSQFGDEGA